MSIGDALDLVSEKNYQQGTSFDLIEISPSANPPVCKIMEFGKYKYELQKKTQQAKKKQKVVEIKEVKFTPRIAEQDFQVKLRAFNKFIEKECKVKVTVQFRGREVEHNDLGIKLIERVAEESFGKAKLDNKPKLEGRRIVAMFCPVQER